MTFVLQNCIMSEIDEQLKVETNPKMSKAVAPAEGSSLKINLDTSSLVLPNLKTVKQSKRMGKTFSNSKSI